MDKGKNVNNIKCHQEKAVLWRMWATALSFVIPAISLGTSMAYSVVGKDFYMRHRNFDGSDALATENKEAMPDPLTIDVTNEDDVDDPFTKDQISWFGMSRLVTGLFKGFKKDVKQYLTQLNLYLQFENDVQFVTCVYHQHQFCFSSKQIQPVINHLLKPVYPQRKM